MDKELENIMQLQRYMSTNPTLEHRSGAVDCFCANVEYQDCTLGNLFLQNTEIVFEHGYNNTLKINELRPPYYGDFWLTKQDFIFKNGKLHVSGVRRDNGTKYLITIG